MWRWWWSANWGVGSPRVGNLVVKEPILDPCLVGGDWVRDQGESNHFFGFKEVGEVLTFPTLVKNYVVNLVKNNGKCWYEEVPLSHHMANKHLTWGMSTHVSDFLPISGQMNAPYKWAKSDRVVLNFIICWNLSIIL